MNIVRIKRNLLVLLLGLLYIGIVLVFPIGCGPTPSPTPSPVPPEFKILSPTLDTEFALGDIITISGTHKLSPEDNVWIFLRDIFRGYYVQNPPAELLANSKWEASNIRPGREIQYIIAIYVNPDGNKLVQGWVDAKHWGKISEEEVKALPGYLELARVKIKTPGSE